MVQRYKFESKSQPDVVAFCSAVSCFQWFKDTNLKVNHNLLKMETHIGSVVSNGSKIQI